MRISDWSSYVCSSDLQLAVGQGVNHHGVDQGVVRRDGRHERRPGQGLRAQGLRARRSVGPLNYGEAGRPPQEGRGSQFRHALRVRSEEHTSELQSLMRISYAVFCLKKKTE